MAEASDQDIAEGDLEKLPTIFKEGLDDYYKILKSDQPTNSSDVQIYIKKTMKVFERATRLVSLANVFSKNEGIEEVATNDLCYFLLPALLGVLTLKLTKGDRKDLVDVAEIYYTDFLKRCNEYGLSNYQFGDKESNRDESEKEKTEFEKLQVAVNTRANKIQRFREQKELESKLETLKQSMENEHVDEEIKRLYFLSLIKLFIYEAIEELNSINMEKPILEHMAQMKKEDKPQPKWQPPAPLKPIIITRNEVQKAVYGAGYPAIPTMTVQEFYDKRVAEGIFPDPNARKTSPVSLQEAALAGIDLNRDEQEQEEKEKLEENDEDDYLRKLRNQDDFKDDHRRGWGNRMNRS